MTRTTKGCLFIAAPFIIMMVVLTVYAVSSFIISAMLAGQPVDTMTGLATPTTFVTAIKIIRIALGLTGVVCLVLSPISVIYGIFLLSKKDEVGPSVPKQ